MKVFSFMLIVGQSIDDIIAVTFVASDVQKAMDFFCSFIRGDISAVVHRVYDSTGKEYSLDMLQKHVVLS